MYGSNDRKIILSSVEDGEGEIDVPNHYGGGCVVVYVSC